MALYSKRTTKDFPLTTQHTLRSFFLGGFECSSHVRPDGTRLDLLASTRHEALAAEDYASLRSLGLSTARDGVRWHLIQSKPRMYDWSSWLPMLRASQRAGVQVIWDLCHYGWPDHLDIWSAAFVDHFARYSRALARIFNSETDETPFYCPINEISFWAWAGGEVARMAPAVNGRGDELKRQLVRAYIASVEAIRIVDRRARFIVSEPLINVVGNDAVRAHRLAAKAYRVSQFQAHDMLTGRVAPELGGRPQYLDLVGVNFYPDNQWYIGGSTIPLGHHAYKPFSEMLTEVYKRYRRPVLVSETGAEGHARPYWLYHVCAEVAKAIRAGVPVEGMCIYPILDYHGWDNDRLCEVGLLSMPDARGRRRICKPLWEELQRQQDLLRPHLPEREQLAG
jgi:hypothetical protein